MTTRPSTPSKADDLQSRRDAAQNVLWWRAQVQWVWQTLFTMLLLVDLGLAGWLVSGAANSSNTAVDLGSRLFGDAEEAAWLGWLTYFGWLFFERMSRARRMRRSARLARLLLQRGHPKWFFALNS
ncbi:MAG: hypothetical protein AAGA48_01135 [Myxococcota bacterium]